MDEEVVLLEEQLSTAHADLKRLESLLGESETRLASREADVAELQRRLDAAQESITGQEVAIATLQQELDAAAQRSTADAQRYRELILAREPELPADLVHGDTIDAVEASLVLARQTVAQVRQHLEQQAIALRVPAGAPVRAAPDFSDLSPAEKIRLGLS